MEKKPPDISLSNSKFHKKYFHLNKVLGSQEVAAANNADSGYAIGYGSGGKGRYVATNNVGTGYHYRLRVWRHGALWEGGDGGEGREEGEGGG